jgi:hypothetical protein
VGGRVQLGPLSTSVTDRPIVPAPGDYDEREFGGMKTGRGNRAPFCPPKIPLDQTRHRTRAVAVGSQRLTAWAMAAAPVHALDRSATVTGSQHVIGVKYTIKVKCGIDAISKVAPNRRRSYSDFLFRRYSFKTFSVQRDAILTEVFRGFPWVISGNYECNTSN